MEKNSYQEKEVSTSNTKRGQYSPRRKDTAPKVNPQLAVELIFQEIKRIEAFTKRIEDATQRKVQIDDEGLKNAVNSLKSPLSEYNEVLSDYRRQANSMKKGGYVNQGVTLACVVIAGLCAVLACGLGYWCSQLKQERDMYKAGYEKLYMEIKEPQDRK